MAPAVEVVGAGLVCRVEMLCRRGTEPARPARVPTAPLGVAPPLPSLAGMSAPSISLWCATILPCPPGAGNSVSFKSSEDSRLLCRSSKLTEGRKSYEPVEVL
jgi:hypothetical protein